MPYNLEYKDLLKTVCTQKTDGFWEYLLFIPKIHETRDYNLIIPNSHNEFSYPILSKGIHEYLIGSSIMHSGIISSNSEINFIDEVRPINKRKTSSSGEEAPSYVLSTLVICNQCWLAHIWHHGKNLCKISFWLQKLNNW